MMEKMALLVKQIMWEKRRPLMLRYFLIFFYYIYLYIKAEIKDKIVQNLKDTENLNFKFEQNINGKIENGNCTIEYPKIFCEYARSNNKILVSNGKSLIIKTKTGYYRYPQKKHLCI